MISNKAAALAVTVAFAVGILASLALRPGSAPPPVADSPTAAPGQPSSGPRWRMPSAFPLTAPIIGEIPQWMIDRADAVSPGGLQIELYGPGELVPAFSIVDAVRDRKVEAGYTWLGYDQGKIPASVLFAASPFGMEPWEYLGWWYEGGGRELADEIYATYNIKPLLCGIIGPETAGWFREPIESLDDIKGLKIRMSGMGGRVLERAGASVTTIPGGEIFQALEKGAIDATEFSQPVIDQALGFDRVAKHNYFPGWHQTFTASHIVIGFDAWNSLNTWEQELLEMACDAVTTEALAASEARQGAVLAAFPEKNVTAHYLGLDILRELRAYAVELLDEAAASDADFARVHASQLAFRELYRLWKENGYLPRDF